MRDQAWHKHLARRQPDLLPYPPFVLVAWICRLEAQGASPHLEHEVDNVLERDIEHVGPVPAAPADMITGALRRQTLKRVVQSSDAQCRPLTVLDERHRRHHLL